MHCRAHPAGRRRRAAQRCRPAQHEPTTLSPGPFPIVYEGDRLRDVADPAHVPSLRRVTVWTPDRATVEFNDETVLAATIGAGGAGLPWTWTIHHIQGFMGLGQHDLETRSFAGSPPALPHRATIAAVCDARSQLSTKGIDV